ncbi:MAG: hypothetical protein SGI92_11425 [Bryobacteraceae bacterium]|nr:hypothetical protein [Bryobacteraceae bacterium]
MKRLIGFITLVAALPAAQAPPALNRLTMSETVAQIRALFHETPHQVASQNHRVLSFHGGAHAPGCDESPQWVFYFGRDQDRLVSATRHFDQPAPVQTLIPKSAVVSSHQTPNGYPVLRAAMPDGRELLAPGARSSKDPVSQLQLIRSADVSRFYPDLRPTPKK